jgi:hypothetical protein
MNPNFPDELREILHKRSKSFVPTYIPLAHLLLNVTFSGYCADVRRAGTKIASGLRLTFESRNGFPADWTHASLAHANWNFHRSQAC